MVVWTIFLHSLSTSTQNCLINCATKHFANSTHLLPTQIHTGGTFCFEKGHFTTFTFSFLFLLNIWGQNTIICFTLSSWSQRSVEKKRRVPNCTDIPQLSPESLQTRPARLHLPGAPPPPRGLAGARPRPRPTPSAPLTAGARHFAPSPRHSAAPGATGKRGVARFWRHAFQAF